MLNINKINVEVSVHELAIANNVTDSQMAAFIFRNFYEAVKHLEVADKIHRHAVAIQHLSEQIQYAMLNKICRYLQRLDGVKVANSNESGSHYFDAPGVKIRISDHIAFSFNPTTTLNIVVDSKTETFAVFYGSRILPTRTYAQLKELLRNFVMVCDVLAPLAELRKPKTIERVVYVQKPGTVSEPSKVNPDYIYIGDLTDKGKASANSMVNNLRKISPTSVMKQN